MAAVVWRRWRAPWRGRPRPWRTGYFERARRSAREAGIDAAGDGMGSRSEPLDLYSVTMMCELLCVSRSGLPAARRRPPSARTVEEAEIVSQIRRTQAQHRGRYGRRRMTPEVIESLGRPVNPKRMGRVMRGYERGSRKRRRFGVVTTDSKHAHPVHGERFKTRADAQQAIIEYMGYDNTERRHSSLGNVSRAECERRGYDESNRVSEASKR